MNQCLCDIYGAELLEKLSSPLYVIIGRFTVGQALVEGIEHLSNPYGGLPSFQVQLSD